MMYSFAPGNPTRTVTPATLGSSMDPLLATDTLRRYTLSGEQPVWFVSRLSDRDTPRMDTDDASRTVTFVGWTISGTSFTPAVVTLITAVAVSGTPSVPGGGPPNAPLSDRVNVMTSSPT